MMLTFTDLTYICFPETEREKETGWGGGGRERELERERERERGNHRHSVSKIFGDTYYLAMLVKSFNMLMKI